MSGEKKSSLGFIVAILAIAVAVLGVLLYLRSEEKETLESEKHELTLELAAMKDDLMAQLGENDSLNSYIQYETARLGAIIDSINLVDVQNKKLLANYRGRLSVMKRENESLVAQLDSANTAYEALKMRERMVADSLNTAMENNTRLANQNTGLRTTVEKGKQLVIASSTTQAVRLTNSDRERNTRRASRTDRVNVCVYLAQNRIADRGPVKLYVKWLDPSGKPVDAPETNLAVVGGERSGYNGMSEVDYQGEAVEVCIAADRATDAPVELEAGIYTLAIMTDSYLVGTVAIELK